MSLTQADLVGMARKGCQTPGCTHDDHDNIFLHQRCHSSRGMRVLLFREELDIRCLCGKRVVCVRLAVPAQPSELYSPCHRSAGLRVQYTASTNQLTVHCRECQAVVRELTPGQPLPENAV